MGVNYDGLCFITSNITAWRTSCVIILGICNDALVFIVGTGPGWSSSIIIGCWVVCVGVGVWSASTVCFSSTTVDEVYACMGCRCGQRCLGNRFSVCIIFIFLHGWEYHVSAAVCLGGVHPLERVGHPLKCAVHPRKYFSSDFLVGPV